MKPDYHIRLSRRVLVDGRLIAPLPTHRHGITSTYVNWGCRCVACAEANAVAMARHRQRRLALRYLVDGRLVAPVPDERHGDNNTYVNWGCRCVLCSTTHAARCKLDREAAA